MKTSIFQKTVFYQRILQASEYPKRERAKNIFFRNSIRRIIRRIIKFIFWRNSRFEFLLIYDKRAIVRLMLCSRLRTGLGLILTQVASILSRKPWLLPTKTRYRLFWISNDKMSLSLLWIWNFLGKLHFPALDFSRVLTYVLISKTNPWAQPTRKIIWTDFLLQKTKSQKSHAIIGLGWIINFLYSSRK